MLPRPADVSMLAGCRAFERRSPRCPENLQGWALIEQGQVKEGIAQLQEGRIDPLSGSERVTRISNRHRSLPGHVEVRLLCDGIDTKFSSSCF